MSTLFPDDGKRDYTDQPMQDRRVSLGTIAMSVARFLYSNDHMVEAHVVAEQLGLSDDDTKRALHKLWLAGHALKEHEGRKIRWKSSSS